MIRPMNLKNIERKILDFNENLTLFDQQFIIIPYLPSGYVDYSNFGQVTGQRYIDDYETYKRVWTGNDSFIITWKDSVLIENTRDDWYIRRKQKLGDYLAGWLENNSSNVDIGIDASFSEYKAQTTEKTLTFRINASRFYMGTNHEFMFYKIPELYDNILFRVDSLEREYLGRDLMCYVLTLKSLNQELANTGRAKQQNVMPSAPGEGYWDARVYDYLPSLYPEKPQLNVNYYEFYGRYIVADKEKQLYNPVKKVVFKAFGLCALSNIAFLGRALPPEEFIPQEIYYYGTPQWIFPMNFTNATTYTLYRTQNEQSNYYWVRNLRPLIQFDVDSMKAFKDILSLSHIWPSEGFAEIKGTGSDDGLRQMWNTNPVKRNPFNNFPEEPYPEQLTGKVVPELQSDGTTKLVRYPWKINIPRQGRGYKTDLVYGCAQYYNTAGNKPVHDVMFDAFWTQKNLKTLPLGFWNTLDFGWTIGTATTMATTGLWYGAAALIGVGLLATIAQRTTAPEFQGFSCMLPASLTDFMVQECSSIFGTNYLNKIKLSYFTSFDQDNEINKLFNTETMNTSFEADLTHYFKTVYEGETLYLTTDKIGQKTYADGTNILQSGNPYLLNGMTSLRMYSEDRCSGFVIDAIHIQGIFQGDYSIEFLDKYDQVIWSGIYQSQGKWSKSVREINTWINTSIYGRENSFISQPVPWPKPPPELDIIGSIDERLEHNFEPLDLGKKSFYFRTKGSPHKSLETFMREKFNMGYISSYPETESHFSYMGGDFVKRDVTIREAFSGTVEDFVKQYPEVKVDVTAFLPTRTSMNRAPLKRITGSWKKSNNDFIFEGEGSFFDGWEGGELLFETLSVPIPLPAPMPAYIYTQQTWKVRMTLRMDASQRVIASVELFPVDYSVKGDYRTPVSFVVYVPFSNPAKNIGSYDGLTPIHFVAYEDTTLPFVKETDWAFGAYISKIVVEVAKP